MQVVSAKIPSEDAELLREQAAAAGFSVNGWLGLLIDRQLRLRRNNPLRDDYRRPPNPLVSEEARP